MQFTFVIMFGRILQAIEILFLSIFSFKLDKKSHEGNAHNRTIKTKNNSNTIE